MSWNKPGNDPRNEKNPWAKKEAPPDLDEVFRRAQAWFAGLFAGSNTPPRRPTSSLDKGNGSGSALSAGAIVLMLGFVYLVSGIYIVQPAERAVLTRFGKYVDTVGPGPHWFPRFIESKKIVNVEAMHTMRQGGPMLTKDENIINVEVAVQYRIIDSKEYLFNVEGPENSLQQAIDSALRYVVGHATLDEALTWGRTEIAAAVRKQVAEAVDSYKAGLMIVEVAMQPATPPEEVKSAFDDVIRAQEDEQRFINEADAYTRQIEPIAEGNAQRLLEDAKAYKEEVSYHAKGDTERFLALLPEYKKAPTVTRDRLYMDTMQEVLSKTGKVIMGSDANGLVYLPIDQMLHAKKTVLPGMEDLNATASKPAPSTTAVAGHRRVEN